MTAPQCTSSLDPQIPPQCFQPTGVGALAMRINVDDVSPLETFLFSTVQLTLGTKSKGKCSTILRS